MLMFFSSYTADGDGISPLMMASFLLHKFYKLASLLVRGGKAPKSCPAGDASLPHP